MMNSHIHVDDNIPPTYKILLFYSAAPELMQQKFFFDDFGDVNDIFDGPTESSEFNFNPEKGLCFNIFFVFLNPSLLVFL